MVSLYTLEKSLQSSKFVWVTYRCITKCPRLTNFQQQASMIWCVMWVTALGKLCWVSLAQSLSWGFSQAVKQVCGLIWSLDLEKNIHFQAHVCGCLQALISYPMDFSTGHPKTMVHREIAKSERKCPSQKPPSLKPNQEWHAVGSALFPLLETS